jgi:pyruvate/2-oxoglutarate dehydrogenase complex dihydrolipoamide acyltransferase (E2) component
MHDVRIPKFGMSTIEVEITDVYVKAGDNVRIGQPLMTIAADKADLDVEADHAGVIHTVDVQPGDIREVGDIVAVIAPLDSK